MTRHPTVKSRDLFSSQPFLMPWPTAVAEAEPVPEASCQTPAVTVADALRDAFPDRPSGKVFIDAALSAVNDSEPFAAMAVRIDLPCSDSQDSPPAPTDAIAVATAVAAVLEAAGGLWGFIEEDLMGWVSPGGCAETAEETSAAIRESLQSLQSGTVITGITHYPLHTFTQEETIRNTRKAVDHAAFFGPNASAQFDAVSLNVSGDILYQNGDIDGAVTEFETALAMDPANANILNSLGVCYGIKEDYDRALGAFEAAIAAAPQEVTALYNAGLIYQLKGNPEKALAFFTKASPQGGDVFEIQFQIGKLLVELERDEEALAYLEAAIDIDSSSAPACRLVGDILQRQGDTEAAIAEYKKAIRLHPNDADALASLGVLYADRGENLDLCITFTKQSVDIEPENGRFRQHLADLYRKAGLETEALEEYRKAKDLGQPCEPIIHELEARLTQAAS